MNKIRKLKNHYGFAWLELAIWVIMAVILGWLAFDLWDYSLEVESATPEQLEKIDSAGSYLRWVSICTFAIWMLLPFVHMSGWLSRELQHLDSLMPASDEFVLRARAFNSARALAEKMPEGKDRDYLLEHASRILSGEATMYAKDGNKFVSFVSEPKEVS